MNSLAPIVLGLINVLIVVAILVLIGAIAAWILGMLGYPIPADIRKIYLAIVALIALYMLAALAFGLPTYRIVAIADWPVLASYV